LSVSILKPTKCYWADGNAGFGPFDPSTLFRINKLRARERGEENVEFVYIT
jgi:hypothetical protein